MDFIVEIVLGLVSAGLLALCGYFGKQIGNYKKLLAEKDDEHIIEIVDSRLETYKKELQEMHTILADAIQKEEEFERTIMASYRFRLLQLCRIYINQNYLTQSEFDQLSEFYKVYSQLGGNGQGKEYYEKVMALPIHPDDE